LLCRFHRIYRTWNQWVFLPLPFFVWRMSNICRFSIHNRLC